jgi:hypothetical protein
VIAAPSLVILPREGESPPHGGRQYGHFLALEVLQPAEIAPMKSSLAYEMSALERKIGIGGHLAVPPLPHHRAYGSRTRRFDWVKLGRIRNMARLSPWRLIVTKGSN